MKPKYFRIICQELFLTIDIEKLCGYCLNPNHDRGKRKARLAKIPV